MERVRGRIKFLLDILRYRSRVHPPHSEEEEEEDEETRKKPTDPLIDKLTDLRKADQIKLVGKTEFTVKNLAHSQADTYLLQQLDELYDTLGKGGLSDLTPQQKQLV